MRRLARLRRQVRTFLTWHGIYTRNKFYGKTRIEVIRKALIWALEAK